ncbi:hypothetical protein [Haliangium ochraceum]|uniref:hypothetical protein n=1 Tax=Haliangium ochraceum TaxID=80816 RepID=UPI0002F3B2A4|nr:hypothetical protein [Haliangium ochraceum]
MPDALHPVDAAPECEQSVGAFVAEHACLHAMHGPFATLSASPPSQPPSADASQPHTAFQVALPALGGGDGYRGVLRYLPRRSGEFAFFTAPGVTVSIADDMGRPTPARLAHDLTVCDELQRVDTIVLDAETSYSLTLASPDRADTVLVVEMLDEFLPSEAYDSFCEQPSDAGVPDASVPPADAAPADAPPIDAAPVDATPPADADCTPRLGAAVVEHTCLHATHGPFGTVTAQPDPATATVNINGSHTYYTVELLPADALYHGVVTYRPTATGLYTLFLDPDLAAQVQQPDGTPVPSVHEEIVTTCPGLTRALVVDLDIAVRYRLVFAATAEPEAHVAVEFLDSFAPGERWDDPCSETDWADF